MMNTQQYAQYLNTIVLPQKDSHKGQNGKLLVVGGSELFHAASAWSLDVASKIVDMVLYSSVTENNEHIIEAKKKFWDGIVIPREHIEQYIEEVDCILIGPGMTRSEDKPISLEKLSSLKSTDIDWQRDTNTITNYLLYTYPQKKWVIDAGALQMVNTQLLTDTMIITPHTQEFERVFHIEPTHEHAQKMAEQFKHVTILLKGKEDVITNGQKILHVSGGNEGMTKGGTGDVLAGIVAALYCKSDSFASAVVASVVNKHAGDMLYESVGPFFNASDLVQQVPKSLNALLMK